MSSVDVVFVSPPVDRGSDSSADARLTLDERFHAGELSALAEVLRELCPVICRRLRKKYKDRLADDRAEHVTLEALDQGWRCHADYDPTKGPLAAWLWPFADHAAADFCESAQGQGRLLEVAFDADRLVGLRDSSARDPSASTCPMLGEELRDLVWEALEAIDAKYRDVLLSFVCAPNGDLSSAQLAAEEGVSASAIRMRRRRGYALLEAELRRRGVEDLLFCDTQTVFTIEGTNKNGERRTENGERRTENGERIIVRPRTALREGSRSARRAAACRQK